MMEIDANVLIIGAGPVGLFQAFYLGLQGIGNIHIVDMLDRAGGQCAELYPTKPIFDIPAIPSISGHDLIAQQLSQLAPFNTTFHFNQEVVGFEQGDPSHRLVTASGTVFKARTVVIATGMGGFQPTTINLPGFDQLDGAGKLHYKVIDQNRFAGKNLIIMGGGDSALDWTVDLAPIAKSVVHIHRTAKYRAHAHTVEKMMGLAGTGQVEPLIGKVVDAALTPTGVRLNTVVETGPRTIDADEVLLFYGLAPKAGPVAQWGIGMNPQNRILVNTSTYETSVERVFAVGDSNTYDGKQKLILSGYHEAALATYRIGEYVNGKKLMFMYTTSSTAIHTRLGIARVE